MGVISKYKSLILYTMVILTVVFGVSIVFGSGLVFDYKISSQKLSNNIFIDSNKLRKNLVIYSSYGDLSDYKLETGCDLETDYLGKKDDDYFFSVSYSKSCLNPNLYLKKDGQAVEGSHIDFNIFSDLDIFGLFVDFKTADLNKIRDRLFEKIEIYERSTMIKDSLTMVILERLNEENLYKLSILNNILKNRAQKYSVPVINHSLPTKLNKIPNVGRGYRANYTDGIHHGWDIDTEFGEEVVALDYGVIVRVVDGFEFSDLSNIDHSAGISYETKVQNLDILRGNQIWLKTSKGDLVFYSHLSEIGANIKEGSFVARGQELGKVGKTGIPDRNYTDFHLHFPIHKNPYNRNMAGKYTFEDYMKWDRYFKGEKPQYVLENQGEIFSSIELGFNKK